MIEKIKAVFGDMKSVINYIFFGILTTFVNVITYWTMARLIGTTTLVSSITAWIIAVLFAYITNRKWVFFSRANSKIDIIKEVLYFYGCRLATGLIDWLIMLVFVDVLHFYDLVIKIVANVVVIVLNFLASRFIVFKRGQ